jgi:hypothetical protein
MLPPLPAATATTATSAATRMVVNVIVGRGVSYIGGAKGEEERNATM